MNSARHIATAALTVAMITFAGTAIAQSAAQPSDQDKHFLQDLGKDSNFEIATSKLALEKSQSADVKAYARMVIHDHDLIKAKLASADRMAKLSAPAPTDMNSDDQAMVDKLKGLSGKDFDTAYIQELVKGNSTIEQEEKSESSDSKVAPIKSIATSAAATDKKHAAKAKELAKAHNVQS